MRRQAVSSSTVSEVGYDEGSRTLEVLFASGITYQYFDVPPQIHAELMQTGSIGQYLNANIKGNFRNAHRHERELAAGKFAEVLDIERHVGSASIPLPNASVVLRIGNIPSFRTSSHPSNRHREPAQILVCVFPIRASRLPSYFVSKLIRFPNRVSQNSVLGPLNVAFGKSIKNPIRIHSIR